MYWQGYTEAPSTCFAVSGLCGLVQGCYAPRNLCGLLLDCPLRDGLRGGLDLENGAIWPLNGLRAKKFHVFRIKGWILDPWGGRVNARNEKTRPGRRVLSGLAELELCLTG